MESWSSLLTSIGFLILFIGIALILIGLLLTIIKRRPGAEREEERESEDKRGKVRGGGVILIGPIPVIFGTDGKALLIAIIASLIFIALYLAFLVKS